MNALIPENFQRWLTLVTDLGFADILTIEDNFKACLRKGALWSRASKTGIYCWVAEDGEAYVGKTFHARQRLLAHARTHSDLRYAAFQPVPKSKLDEREVELITRVNEVLPTRNIKLALQSAAEVPFDEIVTPQEREAFLSGEHLVDPAQTWRDYPLLMQKQAKKFARFMRLPDAGPILSTLDCFVKSVLPRPYSTEGRFWSVSLFPGQLILRVNVGQQEVFTIARDDNGVAFARPLALEPFSEDSFGPMYQTGSYDHWMPLSALPGWLQDERLQSARNLSVWLMRHTSALNFASHCPQLLRQAHGHL